MRKKTNTSSTLQTKTLKFLNKLELSKKLQDAYKDTVVYGTEATAEFGILKVKNLPKRGLSSCVLKFYLTNSLHKNYMQNLINYGTY